MTNPNRPKQPFNLQPQQPQTHNNIEIKIFINAVGQCQVVMNTPLNDLQYLDILTSLAQAKVRELYNRSQMIIGGGTNSLVKPNGEPTPSLPSIAETAKEDNDNPKEN